jgi:uncharacterized protein YbjT (DUF2867 family)
MIVVTGATGNVGRPLMRALTGERVTGVSRRGGDGVRQADLAEPETLRAVLAGADALFLLVAGERPMDILDAAKAGGVRRVVLLSSLGAGTRPAAYPHPRMFEDAVARAGLEATVLRPGGFHSNAFGWADSVRERGTVAAPFGDVGLPSVDPVDIAEVAAVVLRDGGHAGRTYELTGPAAVSPRERARAIGAALGTPVRFVEQSHAQARAELLRFMPEQVVDGTLAILGQPSAAEQRVSPDVARILGREPASFADWVTRNIGAFTQRD